MDKGAFIAWAFTILASIISTAVGVIFTVKITKMGRTQDARTMEYRLLYWGVRAGGELAKQSAIAIQRGTANGELDGALKAYLECEKERDKYMEKQTAMANHG